MATNGHSNKDPEEVRLDRFEEKIDRLLNLCTVLSDEWMNLRTSIHQHNEELKAIQAQIVLLPCNQHGFTRCPTCPEPRYQAVANELTAEAQELGLYDDRPTDPAPNIEDEFPPPDDGEEDPTE